ncbi:DNA polymerase III subunit chi [Viridibacterium curvum]|uniref:DNA polymerase III subunit chi n=1 Tax=Viridibacterium curvum TaxID=1101404 RepID=A0ABP9QK62_9RHOO
MAEVKFYFNAPDRITTACSIAGKAVRQGHRVLVYAPDGETARRFDQLLWSVQPLSFVPHVAASSPLADRTPVVIATSLDKPAHQDVLLNLDDAPPTDFSAFNMLVEIVSTQEEDRQQARQRWQTFKQQGHTITAHDLAKS